MRRRPPAVGRSRRARALLTGDLEGLPPATCGARDTTHPQSPRSLKSRRAGVEQRQETPRKRRT